MSSILTPNESIETPEPPTNSQRSGGILTIKGYNDISTPQNAGQILTPTRHDQASIVVPTDGQILELNTPNTNDYHRNLITPSEIAQAFGNFDAYFKIKTRQYFPEHEDPFGKSSRRPYERVYIEKTYYNRISDRTEIIKTSKPGPLEEACIVALKIAGEPNFVGTDVAEKAVAKANSLLYFSRTLSDDTYRLKLPEMPTLLEEAKIYLSRLPSRKQRYQVYDLISQTIIPRSEISALGQFMEHSGDLDHPLAYRLLTEDDTNSEFYRKQMEKREMMLNALIGDAEELAERYAELSEQAKGLVCSVDVQTPHEGKIGVEIEFGNEPRLALMGKPLRFELYRDMGNMEVARSIDFINLDSTYLADLSELAAYLKDGATHISSLHIHLDRDVHKHEPIIGQLLANTWGSAIYRSHDKNTWEIRGLLPPSKGKELNPADIADIVQLYIVASTVDPYDTDNLPPPVKLPKGIEPTFEQLTFTHICRYISSPEGRLAALKVLEHPLVLRGISPQSLIESFHRQSQYAVYKTLDRTLLGNYAENELDMISIFYNFRRVSKGEKLSEDELIDQYNELTRALSDTGVLEDLPSGERGIIGLDGLEYPIPTISNILEQIDKQIEILGPKMEQGFRKLLLVPFGMKLASLRNKYESAISKHARSGKLFAPSRNRRKGEPINLNPYHPVVASELFHDTDEAGTLLYYPDGNPTSLISNGHTKMELLKDFGIGWKILLVEDLLQLPKAGLGEIISGRLQLESGNSPVQYLKMLKTNPKYANEVGMTPEDWYTYALMYLEETDQIIDDPNSRGGRAYLLGAYHSLGLVPTASWSSARGQSLMVDSLQNDQDPQFGVRVAVRVN